MALCDGEILPAGYVLYRKDRPSRGGGVLIAVKESLFSCIIQSPPDLEIVTVKIGQGNNNVICCVYIPPEYSFSCVSHVVQFHTDLTSSFCKCVIIGDFNFPDIDWSVLMGTSNSNVFVTSSLTVILLSMFQNPLMLKVIFLIWFSHRLVLL